MLVDVKKDNTHFVNYDIFRDPHEDNAAGDTATTSANYTSPARFLTQNKNNS